MRVAQRVTLILYIMYNVAYTLGRCYSTVAYVLELNDEFSVDLATGQVVGNGPLA